MIFELIHTYYEKASQKALVFRYQQKCFVIQNTGLFLTALATFYGLCRNLSSFVDISLFVVLILITAILSYLAIRHLKEFIQTRYGVLIAGWHWCGSEFRAIQIDILRKILTEKGITSFEQITVLLQVLNRRIEKNRFGFGGWTFLGNLLLVIVGGFLTWAYSQTATREETISLTLLSLYFLLLIFGLFLVANGLVSDLSNRHNKKTKELVTLLEEISLFYLPAQISTEV